MDRTDLIAATAILLFAAFLLGFLTHWLVSRLSHVSRRDLDEEGFADQDTVSAGLAWWLKGHGRSLKASAGRLHAEGQPDRLQVLVQLQVSAF